MAEERDQTRSVEYGQNFCCLAPPKQPVSLKKQQKDGLNLTTKT